MQKINVVIPMAGQGSRFIKAGYSKPKPFIDVLGEPMIAHVLENLAIPNAQFILLARAEHYEKEPETIRYHQVLHTSEPHEEEHRRCSCAVC